MSRRRQCFRLNDCVRDTACLCPFVTELFNSQKGNRFVAIIISAERQHISGDDARAQVSGRYGYAEISDGCALTIASWYQSPSGFGTTFAALSTTGRVDHIELLDAIRYERKNASYDEHKALDMLCTWALAHTRDYPRRDDKGSTYWACCVSKIGPVCEHKS